jgi:superfamily II DNA or RNA helicase
MLIQGGEPVGMPKQPKPYPFQERAAKITRRALAKGLNVCLVSPTGSGKTNMAGISIEGLAADEVCAVSTSTALQDQLHERLCPQSLTVQGVLLGMRPVKPPKIVVWDECHHSEADRWRELKREAFPKAQFLGLTPAPQRGDGRAHSQFDEMVVAAHYSELMEWGIIVPCKVSGPEAIYGDKRPDPVRAYMRGALGKKGIIFLPDTMVADDVAKHLIRNKVNAAAYHSNMARGQRKDLFAQFRTGEVQVICAVHALSEGIDVPDAEVGILAQRCENVSQFINSVGRILRSSPETGKKYAHLIDLTGASLRHGHPCSDRDYSLYGAGIYSKETRDDVERAAPDRTPLPTYDANLVTWFDHKWPSVDDKRKQLAFLKRQAAQTGYDERTAERAYKLMFANEQPGGA